MRQMNLKRFQFFMAFVITFTTSIAQDRNTEFGIKGGLNLTFFNIDENDFGSNSTSETVFMEECLLNFQ